MNTTYFLNLVAGNVFGSKKSPAIPANYYIGVSKTNPASSVSEPSGGAYARMQLTGLGAPSNGVVTNPADISFPESTAVWGTVTHFVIYDAATGGNLLMHGALTSARSVEANTILTIRSGSLKLTAANS